MRLPGVAAPPDLSTPGPLIPGFVVRVGLVIVGGLLTLVDFGAGGWLVVGIAFALAAAAYPQGLLGWALILFLGAGELAHHPGLTVRLLILLAGLHLLHALALLTLELPWRSWVQAAVFIAPLRRFVAVQVPTQLVAVVALLLLAPARGGHRPLTVAAFGVVGAVALAGVGLLLLGPHLREDPPPPGP